MRHDDRDDDEAGQSRPVALEIAWRCVVRSVEQHRRDKQCQRKIGLDAKDRDTGDKRQTGAAEGEERWIRRAGASCESGQNDRRQQQADQGFERRHGALNSTTSSRPASGALLQDVGDDLERAQPRRLIEDVRGYLQFVNVGQLKKGA